MPRCFGYFDCLDDYCWMFCPYSIDCEYYSCPRNCDYCPWCY